MRGGVVHQGPAEKPEYDYDILGTGRILVSVIPPKLWNATPVPQMTSTYIFG